MPNYLDILRQKASARPVYCDYRETPDGPKTCFNEAFGLCPTHDFSNTCHSKDSGRFCETHGVPDRVKKLNLPEGKYAVAGSAWWDIKGIRRSKDLDIVVTPDVYEELQKREGWKTDKHPAREGHADFESLSYDSDETGPVQVIRSDRSTETAGITPNLNDWIKNAEKVDGVPVVKLQELYRLKKAYNRTKDQADIKAMDEILAKERISASAALHEFYNKCHAEESGKFCETSGRIKVQIGDSWFYQDDTTKKNGRVRPITGAEPTTPPGDSTSVPVPTSDSLQNKLKNLTGNGEKALHQYISGAEGGFIKVNEALRGISPADQGTKETIKGMEEAFDQASVQLGGLTVHRGVPADVVQGVKVGQILKDKGYSSTSTSISTAIDFADEGAVLTIKTKPDTRGLAGYGQESEVILDKGTQLKIISKETHDGIIYIEAEVV